MKKILVVSFILFLSLVNSALAHTGLESSTPTNGEILNEELQQITLTFETKVEQGSTFQLQNSNGESISVENLSLSENQLVGGLSDPLTNGEYTVNWKIIGSDGHAVEGEYSFTVELPVTQAPAKEPNKTQEEKQEVPVNEVNDEEIQQNDMPTYVIPTIIGVLIVIVVVCFLWIIKRKK